MQGRQTGSLLLAAIALIVVIAGLVVSLNFLAVSDNASGGAQAASGQALAAAKAGIEQATRALRSSTQATFALACTVSVPAASAAVGSGAFTLSATRYNPATTLGAAVANATATSVQLTSSAGFAPHGTAIIDSERINYTGISGNILTGVTRGLSGTLAKAHATAGPVTQDLCRVVSKGSSGNALRQVETTLLNGQWSEYIDGASTPVLAAATTLATINATMPAGDNIIIAVVTLNKATAGAVTFAPGVPPAGLLRLLRNGVAIESNRYTVRVGGAAGSATVRPEKTYFFVFKDSSAPANPAYSITAQGSAVGVNAEAKMLVINGPAGSTSFSYFASGPGVAFTNATTSLLSAPLATTGVRAEDFVLAIAAVHVENTGAARNLPVTTGLVLRRNPAPGTTLGSNQYVIGFGAFLAANTTTEYSVLLSALDTTPGVNPTYDVAALGSAATAGFNGTVDLLLIRGVGSVFFDSASVTPVATPPGTVLGSQVTTTGATNGAFPSLVTGAANLVIAGINYSKTALAAVSTTAIGEEEIIYNGVRQTSNTFASTLCTSATAPCNHFESALLWRQAIAPATPTFSVQTSASAATTAAETKLVVINLDPIGDVLEVFP